jgi:DNA repair exonuclease SbcCD nuclease subunit
MPENVKIFSTKKPETVLIEELNIAVHGQGFHQRAVTENIAASYPEGLSDYFNIGILHTSVTGREGHETYAPCQIETLLSKQYDYWALGHVHKSEILYEDPWIIFPGNIQGRHIRETGPKGCTLVTIDDGKIISVDQRDLDVLRWCFCTVSALDAETPDVILERVREEVLKEYDQNPGKTLAVRILVTGSCKAHESLMKDPDQWISQIRADATDLSSGLIWIEKVTFRTSPKFDHDKIQGPIRDLIQYIQGIEAGDIFLKYLKEDYPKLKGKLPRELYKGENALDLESPDKAKILLEDAKHLLTSLLLSGGSSD